MLQFYQNTIKNIKIENVYELSYINQKMKFSKIFYPWMHIEAVD